MARDKSIDTNPRFLPVDLAAQLLPGTLEYALHYLLGHAIDLSHLDARRGARGAIRNSIRTDNESAKMATGKGVVQAYCGGAAVEGAHHIIVEAQALGTGSDRNCCCPS